ncbi:papilin [Venturia canescens]|uniref:papilin n=1 Tax=Venturia canescens TaxID=32260 RepID=UPI001C9CCD39|nr:papilin [Venturia canescens]
MYQRLKWSLVLLVFVIVTQVADVSGKYHHIKVRHGRHRRQHANSYLPSSFVPDTDEPERGNWGPWTPPSSCSRSCGGGVAHQTRQCRDVDDNGYDRCTGAKKRFFSCNIQECTNSTTDFRAEQCAEFNNVEFEGVYYDWIPYTGGPNKCELNCRPKGERFFYRHKLSVVDGTPCDLERNDVCVEGKCMPVGCDMMLGSEAREDSCRECGGDGSDCNTVNGVFDTDDLQVGYIDILLIPQGATNIVVKEVAPSNNYLAVRNTTGFYYLNGHWRIDFPRSLRFAGTIFHYARDPQGFSAPDTITALGPTTEAIYIVLLYQDRNVGVNYEYSIPKKFSQQADPDSYTWVTDEFSECSSTCGGGYKSRRVMCVKRRDNAPVDDNLCDRQLEPDDTELCGNDPCPSEWVANEWGPCSKQCGEGGERTREIKCEQIVAGGIPRIVDDSECLKNLGPKNETTEKCNENVECPKWHEGPWKPCDHLCGPGKQKRRVICYRKNEETGKIEALEDSACSAEPMPEREKACENRPCAGLDWVTSEWSGCDEKCGLTRETRTAHCATQDGTTYPDDKCVESKKPEVTRKCENPKSCEFLWYTSQWSECSAKCGKGIRSRAVFCAGFEGDTLKKVDDEKCDSAKKFNDTEECQAEVEECKGEWFAGPWSKCSKPCGGGDMSRKVVCLSNGTVVPPSNCEIDVIMFASESCNDFTCSEDQVLPVEPGETQVPTDEDEECEVYEDEEKDFVTFDGRFSSEEDNEVDTTGKTRSPLDTDSSGFTSIDDTMLSDAPYSRGDITPVETGSGSGSGDTEYTGDILSTIYNIDSSASPGFEGSGATTDEISSETEPAFTSGITESSTTEVTGDAETGSGFTETGESITTVESGSESSGGTTEMSAETSDESATSQPVDASDATTEISTESSASSEMSGSTNDASESSEVTDESSTDSATEFSTDGETGTTISATSDSSVSEISTDMTATSSSDSSYASTDATSDSDSTESTDTPDTEPTETTVTDNTESTPTDVTESTLSTDSSASSETDDTTVDSSTIGSSETTEGSESSSSDVETTEANASESSFTFGDVNSEYDPEKVSETSESGSSETTTSDAGLTTDATSSESVTDGSTDSSTSSDEFGSTVSTDETGVTEESTIVESRGSTASEESSETSVTDEATESGATTESEAPTESGGTTESSDLTSETETTSSDSSTEAVTTGTSISESEGSTESEESTVSGETTATMETSTAGSDMTTGTSDEWDDLTGQSHITDIWTTISPVDAAITREHKMRKCLVPKKKSCKKSEFGCCYDGVTAAQGPFDKGCPTPKTCEETVYGCCPDGVSPSAGPNNEDCPFSHCNETLFGCCPDGITIAEGNENEGCKKPCNETEFGCCPDRETAASGKDNLGCCNVTEHGCCPDGMKAASGADLEGCEDEVTTPVTSWTESETEEYESTTSMPSVEPSGEDCANSTYGCCPNGLRVATGENFAGCGVINQENCTASYFGCCPDGESAALGPSNAGCRSLCANTTYGCCEDDSTPAHGPNQEGCCLTSTHGCCPDNITPARGPDFYGCGCQYSRFRCCPDNATAARGHNNEGCGCQYTPHGCCPNRFTPATGPNFEGCPCHTYQFGCCPDGITVAKGPHGQGCGCEHTEFKCCSDGRTPARGANFAGCTCESSKFGCCLDGVEEAQGENFEGCLSLPTNPGAACGLARDRGPCRDFTVKWFFDTEYGGCSRFWYGGCDGNDNRFKSQEECKEVCVAPPGKEACYLPKIAGRCEGYHPKWYYDTERKQCGQFIYGGCLGNANRFESREQCEELCSAPDGVDPCEQPKESGPCKGNFTRWYYDKERQSCEQFVYGGCKANDNNYPTEIACHQQCLQPGHSRDSCSLPRDEGNCTEKHSRWFFDRSENRCMPFYFTGCGGNRNNFDSRRACESDCPPKIEQDTCLLPALLGECHNYTQRWFYDSYEQRCRPFYYGGCGGNGNNFETEHECAGRCEKSLSTPAPPAVEFRTEFCFLPDERGTCNENTVKWFYDSRDGICKQFHYSGCGSNGNKFDTREECEYRCGEVQDACAMPKVVGPCNGFVTQYYYERRTDTCEEFEYSGCAGNKNRFQDRRACEAKCREGREPSRRNETSTIPPVPTQQVLPTSPICFESVDAGPCDGDVTAYYYDPTSKSCQAFIYGGCKGNANRFQTEEQCERLCGRFQGQDACNLPSDTGPCRGIFPKIFYDPSARICREFIYGGCDGNANRFSSVPECESVCIHREEPAPAGNDTALSHFAICREPVDIGSCSAGNYKRFYYDDDRQTCMPFLYTGCGGNRNNFKTFESCLNTCFRTSNEIDVGGDAHLRDPCAEAHEECAIIRCPYGKEAYVDNSDCERCRCVDPCRVLYCPEGTRCSISLVATGDGTEYRGVCRSTSKPGNCPVVSNSTRCERECSTDADCVEDTKCCDNGCGTSCLEPAPEPQTTLPPIFNITAPPYGAEPAAIKTPEQPEVRAEEGSYVTMTCYATGNPRPAITWRKDTTIINAAEKRRRILGDGSLQIINLYSYDRGTYVCTADNGLGPPARTEYHLEVTEPHDRSAAIVGEPSTFVTVTMNSPTVLHCYAMGWPRPFVTWWRGDRMLPLSSEYYEQDSDYTLLIRSVTLTNLGVYTCQAYNGIERPASWSVTLQAIGPVYNIRPDQLEYAQYLVQPPKRPDRPATERPQYPYRPSRTQIPDNQTYAPIYPTQPPPHRQPYTPRPAYTPRQPYTPRPAYTPPGVIPIENPAPQPFRVPVNVNVSTDQTEYPVGSDISLHCTVDGYPIPTVLWYKNDELILTDDRIKISESNQLVISSATNNDTGTYRCDASNENSRSTASVDIRVEGMYIHPDCQDNAFFAKCDLIVFAKYCRHQYYAKFCCRSCTEAGQLSATGPRLNAAKKRRRRSSLDRWLV